MAQLFHSLLSDDLHVFLLSLWLDVRSLTTLDVAVSSSKLRPNWPTVLRCLRSDAMDNWGHSLSSLTDVDIEERYPCVASANEDG